MVGPIDSVRADMRLAQLLGDNDLFAQAPYQSAQVAPAAAAAVTPSAAPAASGAVGFSGNAFEDILSKAIESMNGISQTEIYANQMAEKFAKGQVEMQDVMVAQAKMSVAVTMAVTTINAAVNTFKELTQMQI